MLDDLGVGFPTLFDPSGDVAYAMGRIALPYTVAFGPDGRMAARVHGELTDSDLDALIRSLGVGAASP